jgi:pyruvate-ferredoxin/flavodoxin oxidoreductase
MNFRAVDQTLEHLHEVRVPERVTSRYDLPLPVAAHAPAFVQEVTAKLIAGLGDTLPVSALPADGTYPTGTAQWEKRNLAQDIPVWDPDVCIQCGKCAMVCPHSVIRIKVYDEAHLAAAPPTFKAGVARDREWHGLHYTIQVAPEDCTGCGICVDVCPAKNKSATRFKAINMQPQAPLRAPERDNWAFFLGIPEHDRRQINVHTIRQQQVQQPLFEFSGACAGCGETPYLKLVSQLFGDRAVVANATGCSSIYGGNLPTTPWTTNAAGRGPAWSNSLFEDNAEFGLGMRLALDVQYKMAAQLLKQLAGSLDAALVDAILTAPQQDEADIYDQRQRVTTLKTALQRLKTADAQRLLSLAEMLVKKSVWIIGGDGWAYDIGFGGLDHVLASGHNVNVLVLDTEVYSNTGGQMSKATPRAAMAKFAASGKPGAKKDLGLIAMSYGNVYVASVAMGARDEHTLRAFLEAEAYDGPSLIMAYSHCIAHGINMTTAMQNQKAVVDTGQWLLYRYHPERAQHGENPLQLDSRAPRQPLRRYLEMETRFTMLSTSQPEVAKALFQAAQQDVDKRWQLYEYLAAQASNSQGQ